LSNSIQALTIVELLDKVLSNYGDAYEVGFGMTNMSMMTTMMNGNRTGMNLTSFIDMGGDNMSMSNISATDGVATSYQTAQVLATKAQDLFNSQLMNNLQGDESENADQSTDKIAAALQELVRSIDRKAPPMEIMARLYTLRFILNS
jgi:hypothetical protein